MTNPCECGGSGGDASGAPAGVTNRPGLSALAYRVGTHATFFAAMRAQLAQRQTPRSDDLTDPANALMDAWAVVADVLTFYQERIANEGYLRTATEQRSLIELTRLIGYARRPGVAATAYLAYGVQDLGNDSDVAVPPGSKVQSMPVAGEVPQTFETSAPLVARASWSTLAPRSTQAQQVDPVATSVLYLQGTSTMLQENDPVLIVPSPSTGQSPKLRRVETVETDLVANRIKVTLQGVTTASAAAPGGGVAAADVSALPPAPPSRTGSPVSPPDAVAETRGTTSAHTSTASAGISSSTSSGTSSGGLSTSTLPASPLVNPALLARLGAPPAAHPMHPANLPLSAGQALDPTADTGPQLLTVFNPALRTRLYDALRRTTVAPPLTVEVFAFRVHAAPFGSTAPLHTIVLQRPAPTGRAENAPAWPRDAWSPSRQTPMSTVRQEEWTMVRDFDQDRAVVLERQPTAADLSEDAQVLCLDNVYEHIKKDSWIVIDRAPEAGKREHIDLPIISRVQEVRSIARADYGLSAKATQVRLEDGVRWIDPAIAVLPADAGDTTLGTADSTAWIQPQQAEFAAAVRGSTVFAQSEALVLAEAPIETPIGGGQFELADVVDGLKPGRWLLVTGERTDIPDTPGIAGAEVVMLAGAAHHVPAAADGSPAPGEHLRTVLTLAAPLSYTYTPQSMAVQGNVIPATQGETRSEVLGSGDARAAFRSFTLRQAPLTWVPAATPTGIASTLQIRVNDVAWQEVPNFDHAGPTDRVYTTRTLDDGTTQVTFGNGTQGARLPTGVENIKASYRVGIGRSGNTDAGKISQLATRPLGVKDVINPVPASGGADPETPDEIRGNAGRGLAALDRLVSAPDYEDFASNFAGVAKASVRTFGAGTRELVHVTIAAADDQPLDAHAPLLANLRTALAQSGDPYRPVAVAPRETLLLVLFAKVRTTPAQQWEDVSGALRTALLKAFSFARRALGQSVMLSEVIAVMQPVAGVAYVDVELFDRVGQATLFEDLHRISSKAPALPRQRIEVAPARLVRRADGASEVLPAQIAYLTPDVPATLVLTQITT